MMATAVHNKRAMTQQEAGFSMLEVLIALVVFSVGLLGMAMMQQTGMQTLAGSGQLSDAVYLAEDMADRIRANRGHAVSGTTYNSIDNAVNAHCVASCSAAQIAAKDLFDWDEAVNSQLSGVATIARSGDSYNITVSWNERNRDDPNLDVIQKQYQIRIKP